MCAQVTRKAVMKAQNRPFDDEEDPKRLFPNRRCTKKMIKMFKIKVTK